MRCLVVVLYCVALLMQLGGAGFVIHDVIQSTAAMRKFIAEWKRLTETPGLDWPHFKEPVLAELVTVQNVNAWRRWIPVGSLVAGVILVFLASVLALDLHEPFYGPAWRAGHSTCGNYAYAVMRERHPAAGPSLQHTGTGPFVVCGGS